MNKKNVSILGIGLLAATQLASGLTHNKENEKELLREENSEMEFIMPGLVLNEFESKRYKISFKYPRGWTKNPRYEDKYEGESGFFEVGDFASAGENIDDAVKAQVNEYYKPYGSNPTIRKFVIDGQPARVIYPSADQSEFFKDREAAIVVKYPTPIVVDGEPFEYVVIWVSKAYVPLIVSTMKFTK